MANGMAASAGDSSSQSGLAVWAMPMYQNQDADGFKSGSFNYGYDIDFAGMSLGTDFTTLGKLRIGAALHVGGGDSDSKGDFAASTNDFDFFGFSVYTGYQVNNFGISADIGYTTNESDARMNTVTGPATASPDSKVYTKNDAFL